MKGSIDTVCGNGPGRLAFNKAHRQADTRDRATIQPLLAIKKPLLESTGRLQRNLTDGLRDSGQPGQDITRFG